MARTVKMLTANTLNMIIRFKLSILTSYFFEIFLKIKIEDLNDDQMFLQPQKNYSLGEFWDASDKILLAALKYTHIGYRRRDGRF